MAQLFIILGDVNGYIFIWGSDNTDSRGREVERFIANLNINIISEASTRILYITESPMDLAMRASMLEADLHRSIAAAPGGSDHCPIFITCEGAPTITQIDIR